MQDAAVRTTVAPAYSLTARTLHWVTAALVLIMIPIGIVIANEWGGPLQERLYNLHKSLGAALIPIIVIRLIYRIGHAPPPLPDDIPTIQQLAAHATHGALYGLLVVQPVIGWVATSAYPAPVPVFGIFELPSIWPENRALSDKLFALHRWIGIAIGVLAATHIGAALFHHFMRKDRVLSRMLGS